MLTKDSEVLRKQGHDEDIVHLVPFKAYQAGRPVTLCGIDMTGREPRRDGKPPDCVVCIELKKNSRS